VLELRSGNLTVGTWLTPLRGSSANQQGLINVTGGTFMLANSAQNAVQYAIGNQSGQFQFNVSGAGRLVGGSLSSLNLMNAANADSRELSVLNVSNGGTVQLGQLTVGTPNGIVLVNSNNGVFRAVATQNNFIDGRIRATTIYSGGMTMDTNGFAVGIKSVLAGANGAGVSSVTLSGTGTNYIGAPLVQLVGGGGIGATAVAVFNEATGQVTGITVTNPGTGYTSAPTVLLTGGAGSPLSATASLAANATDGGLTKVGLGTLSLGATNTYVGGTRVLQGGLTLDFTAIAPAQNAGVNVENGGYAFAPIDNILSAAGTLTLNATPVTILGRETQFNTQTLAGLVLQTAQSTVTLTAGANGAVLLNTGVISRSVGTTLRLDAGANTGLSVTNSNTNGILGGWFTVGTAGFATTDGARVTALSTYGSSLTAGTNADVPASANVTSGATVNSLRFNTATASTLTLAGALNLQSGGLLVTPVVGAAASGLTGGSLVSGQSELFITQNNATTPFTIASAITDNAGAVNLVKTGAGTLILSGANSYTGSTYINAGTIQVAADSVFGAAPSTPTANLVFQGGGLSALSSFTLDANRSILLGADSIIDAATGATLTVAGTVSGPFALTKTGAGTVVLGAANTYTGNTRIAAGSLTLGNAGSLTNSTLDLNTADLGTLSFGTLTAATAGGLQGTRALTLSNDAGTPAAVRLTVGGNNQSTAYSGVLGGLGGITKNGTGALALVGLNTNTGKTVVNGGTLIINRDASLGTAPGSFTADSITLNGGTLLAAGAFVTNLSALSNPLNANRGITLTAPSTIGAMNVVTTGTSAANSYPSTLTVVDATGIQVGMLVSMANFNAATYVKSINGNVLTLSNPAATANAAGTAVTFVSNLTYFGQITGAGLTLSLIHI
jgi:fibronectin-binding autotransporter adhesin